jgi:hypothetical protein
MHYDDICLTGTNCILSTGNRNLADFFVVTIDKTGAAEIVYDDTSNLLIQSGTCASPPQLADHCGAGVITVARQSSGPGLYGTAVTGPSNAPVGGLSDPPGDALFPVIGGNVQRGMDIVGNSMQLSADGSTLRVTMRVIDLSDPTGTASAITGTTNLQYVTRWQFGNTLYYAAMENTPANQQLLYYAGKVRSIDLCSVSACFPHVLTYPEPNFGGTTEPGTISCPETPSASNPCSVTISVPVGDIGMTPTTAATSLLEEVGGYALAATIQEGAETNATAQSDTVPLEIDGVCCYNFKASVQNGPPPACHEADGNGDIHSARNGKASFSMDEDRCEDQDNEDLHAQDTDATMNFQSTAIQSAVFNDATNSVTLVGAGTNNGNPVTFTAVAIHGLAGVGAFTLTLSDGYTNSGTLLAGSIELH